MRELADAPAVIGVGDIHLENYGVWRDGEGRLVWGVNDFDEAAEMPYAVDVVRLAASAILSQAAKRSARKSICADILEGYRRGLAKPRPFTLDEKHLWLRTLFAVKERRAPALLEEDEQAQKGHAGSRAVQQAARGADARRRCDDRQVRAARGRHWKPGASALCRRGHLARRRLVREAKAPRPVQRGSLSHRQRSPRPSGALIANGRYRAPDPWYQVDRHIVVRRLSPNARKIEVVAHPIELAEPDMLQAMGYELANVHLGTGDRKQAIEKNLDRRKAKWLVRAAETAAEFVIRDFEEWNR